MKIQTITIRNFRSITDSTITPGDASIFFGLNGAGKSSILYAVQMALFGFCELTDKAGRGAGELIKDGEKFASVDIVLDDGFTVEYLLKQKKSTLTIIDTTTGETLDIDRRGLFSRCGIDFDHALIAAMPAQFLDSKEISGILADMLSAGVSVDAVRSLAGDHYDWMTATAEAEGMKIRSVDDLRGFGEWAYGHRTSVNKEAKEARAEFEAICSAANPNQDRAAVAAKISALQHDRDALQRERGTVENFPDAATARASLDAAVGTMEAAKAAHTDAALAFETAANVQTAARRAEADASGNSRRAADALRQADKDIEVFDAREGGCPTCGREYNEDSQASIRATLLRAKENAETVAAESAEAAAEALAELSDAHKAAAAAKRAMDEAAGLLGVAERNHERFRDVVAAIAKARPIDAIDADIATIDARLAKGNELLDRVACWDEREGARVRLERLESEAVRLDWAVKAFKDGSLINQMVAGGLNDFVAACNTELTRFGFELLAVVAGKSVAFIANDRPIRLLSAGQRALVQYAVAVAFSHSGAPVMLDDLNHIDGSFRRELLMHVAGNVIAACAWQQTATRDLGPVARALPGVGVYWVDAGNVQRVECAVEVA